MEINWFVVYIAVTKTCSISCRTLQLLTVSEFCVETWKSFPSFFTATFNHILAISWGDQFFLFLNNFFLLVCTSSTRFYRDIKTHLWISSALVTFYDFFCSASKNCIFIIFAVFFHFHFVEVIKTVAQWRSEEVKINLSWFIFSILCC